MQVLQTSTEQFANETFQANKKLWLIGKPKQWADKQAINKQAHSGKKELWIFHF